MPLFTNIQQVSEAKYLEFKKYVKMVSKAAKSKLFYYTHQRLQTI